MTRRPDDQMVRWPDDQKTGWPEDRMARSPDDQMPRRPYGRRPYGQKSRWHIKQILKKWCSQCYTGYTPNVLPAYSDINVISPPSQETSKSVFFFLDLSPMCHRGKLILPGINLSTLCFCMLAALIAECDTV